MAGPAEALRRELTGLFESPDPTLDDDAFNDLALRIFARNVDAVPPYRLYCRARNRLPESVRHWTEIPAVPTAGFRDLTLLARDASAERVFRTSGTTRGEQRRGAHHVADLELYRASLRSAFHSFVLPDDARLTCLSLMPPADDLPESSLAFMIDDVVRAFGDPESRSFATLDGMDYPALEEAARDAIAAGRPALLLGTSAAFIHWLDRLAAADRSLPLPPGSRLMDTGGFKGRGREVAPAELRRLYRERLGLPAVACVNEYGMTELLSQRYDGVLRRAARAGTWAGGTRGAGAGEGTGADEGGRRAKAGPAWLRSVAVDPRTLEPRPDGETGILRHVDLANLDSVMAVQTEDVGRVLPGGEVVLEGRLQSAPPRGCSAAMDLLLERS